MTSVPDPVRPPANPDTKIWRYINFAKFISLLETKSLFFSRSDLLGDSFEFTYPKANFNAFAGTPLSSNNEFFLWLVRIFPKQLFVNCWHMNEHESTAMWELYLKGAEGVAIQTTYKHLVESLRGCPYTKLDIGMVDYVDYELDRINDQNMLQFIFHKRIQFSHEKELRAVIWLSPTDSPLIPYDPDTVTAPTDAPPGLFVPVELETLIERIVIPPGAPDLFKQQVEALAKKHRINCPVVQSSLSSSPLK